MLLVVWAGALLGAAFQVLGVTAPRWLYVPIYIGLGWAAVLLRPNPVPAWFGFHEVFHGLTVAAFLAHYLGVWVLAFG